ncbi:DUF1311 domain-containing protein [Roseomonas sp. PWR1]|uniref:DUF1311 domain-containing protein n=1 Tax=Roseomonas nitratireducens TaxID=2820810 RepID=A0ABS4AYE0_9PROT|nr:lysozyme inhibitor LprI family protein [Neoroseomonas nitratireducens]MBP0466390.1 DUF1311 domain-containing protein [Neoroseomonas nitratireducens]
MIRALVALLLLAPLPALAQAGPSFNCAQARAWDEQAICAQADLAELDRRIAAAWRSVTERATPEDRQRLQGEQRAWLAERRACQGPNAREAQSCVRRLMRARARDLEALAQGGAAGTASSASAALPTAKPDPAAAPAAPARAGLAAVTCPATSGWAARQICATPGMAALDTAVVRDAEAARARLARNPPALAELDALLARYVAAREACARAAGRVPLDCLQETMEETQAEIRRRMA